MVGQLRRAEEEREGKGRGIGGRRGGRDANLLLKLAGNRKELQEKKPFLFTQPEPDKKPGTQNAGASWKGTGKIFTTSDLQSMTPKQREDNREEIDRQFAAGLLK